MSSTKPRPAWPLGALAAVVGALVAAVLGLVTFGVQATVSPHGLPVAVALPDAAPAQLRAAAEHLAGSGGGALSWRVGTPQEARRLLDDKNVYGILELAAGPAGPSATVVVSGAINPSGTQAAQQALTAVGQAVTQAAGGAAPVRVDTVHPASVAGRTAPLAVSALTWIGCLVGGVVLTALGRRSGRRLGVGTRLLHTVASTLLAAAVVAGFLRLWDSSLPLGRDVLGFVVLTAAAFAAVQGALLRVLGLGALPVLGPLYLLAPSVAGQVPELLHPAYKNALWSWTPFRFSTEGVRSLLQGTPGAPDVASGRWVLGAMLVAGLLVLLWPARRSGHQDAEPSPPNRIVEVETQPHSAVQYRINIVPSARAVHISLDQLADPAETSRHGAGRHAVPR